MSHGSVPRHVLAAAVFLSVAACSDLPTPLAPPSDALYAAGGFPAQDVAAWFARSSPDVMAIPGTVFADHDEDANRLVFGVENPGLARAVQTVLLRHGVPAEAYEIRVTEPIHFMSETLRTRHRPTVGGIQIHFPGFLCTLGFNVSHGAGRSFITNSHCTSEQGSMTGTPYWQPLSSVDDTVIATEADDPAYFTGRPCPEDRRCRYSDAARAAYSASVESSQGVIARTTGVNNGSLTVDGAFTVTSQASTDTTFSGTIHKVGRTTGWTSGNVSSTCTTVNVGGTDITLLCQTMVQGSFLQQIVGGGDSGSPAFRITSGNDVELVGILWGGSLFGDLFVFSPLKGVLDELGAFDATAGAAPPPPPPPPPATGSIAGTVTAQGGGAIAGATVTVDGTSHSATTNASGAYTIGDVPAGTYSVTASASGYTAQTQAGVSVTDGETTTVDFQLAPVASGGDMSVSDITITGTGGPNRDRHLRTTVTVVANGSPVSGALVQATLQQTSGGTGSWNFSGTTGSNGTVTFSLNNAPSGCYSLTVTNVSASGLTWDGSSPDNEFCKS
jgi:hypothetical protein